MAFIIGLICAGLGAFLIGRALADEEPVLFMLGLTPLLYGLHTIYA